MKKREFALFSFALGAFAFFRALYSSCFPAIFLASRSRARKKRRRPPLEITLNVINADMDKTLINKKCQIEKTSNGKNVDMGTKGRKEKTSNLDTKELEYFKK
jgi:hypothetical protein